MEGNQFERMKTKNFNCIDGMGNHSAMHDNSKAKKKKEAVESHERLYPEVV